MNRVMASRSAAAGMRPSDSVAGTDRHLAAPGHERSGTVSSLRSLRGRLCSVSGHRTIGVTNDGYRSAVLVMVGSANSTCAGRWA